jgi:putative ABC transport system substrate-binding protein
VGYGQTKFHADKILKGANPTELPIEEPRKFDLAVNLKGVLARERHCSFWV